MNEHTAHFAVKLNFYFSRAPQFEILESEM